MSSDGASHGAVSTTTATSSSSAIAPPPPPSSVAVRNFSEPNPDGVFHFHVVAFSQQIYLWVGFNHDRSQGEVQYAVPTKFDRMPLSMCVLGGSSEDEKASMACRLAKRAGCGVVLASNIPANSHSLQAFAERRLAQEVDALMSHMHESKP